MSSALSPASFPDKMVRTAVNSASFALRYPTMTSGPKAVLRARCKYCMNVCTQEQPPYFAEDKHRTMCWLLDGEAPKNSDYEMRKAGVNFGR